MDDTGGIELGMLVGCKGCTAEEGVGGFIWLKVEI